LVKNHWVDYPTKEIFKPNLSKFGFVYIITNLKNGKAYVGCKQYYIGKTKKESGWESYIGSSKYLKEDIEKIGEKYFTFEVIAEYKNKRSLNYYEMYYQVKWHVLTATMKGSDEPAYYNSYVGGKFYRPIESYVTKNYLITFKDNSQTKVTHLGEFSKNNGYDHPTLLNLRKGFQTDKRCVNKKFTRTKHKDIIKIEELLNNEDKRL